MKKKLNEAFEWKVEERQNQSGGKYYIAAIDPNLSTDDTYAVKDQLKKFGARWDNMGKQWYFPLSGDPAKRREQIEKVVKPCVEYLKGIEKVPSQDNAEATLQKIIAQIDMVINSPDGGGSPEEEAGAKDIKARLEGFKQELINAFRDNTFREKMGPIIKFRQAQGAGYSILNSILIMMQKGDAKMVKSAGKWAKANKAVKPGAKPIYLWCPVGKKQHSPEERLAIEVDFYKKMEKLYGQPISSRKQLNIGDRERLEKKLNEIVPAAFKLRPNFFDISDVEQIAGKEDLIGSPDRDDNIEWFDETTPADAKSEQLFDAIIDTIESLGISVTFVPDLGGARGVSKGGKIEVLENAPKNIGTVSTLVHELSHELLHQTYLKTKGGDKEDYARYFVGREFGKQIVEQQAEISAWIVMRNFGYDMQTAKNYVACWGGDDKTAAYAFDTVAKVSTLIIKGMNSSMGYVDDLNEGAGQNTEITGLDVARMVGMEDTYMKGKKAQQMSTDAKIQAINEQFNNFLNRINNVEF